MSALTRTINKLGEAFEAFKEANDQRLEQLAKGNKSAAAEIDAKIEKINSEISQLSTLKSQIEAEQKAQKERIEELEMRVRAPGRTAEDKTKQEYSELFEKFLRSKGKDPILGQKLKELEAKAVTIGSQPGGGYAVPEELAREIERQELLFSPVRSLVRVVQAGSPD